MSKRLKLSGNMKVIPINRETQEAEVEQEHPRLTANQIVNAIYEGGFDNEALERISGAVRAMWKANRADRLTEAQCKLHNGKVVMLVNIRPKKLIGMTGQVENFMPGRNRANLRVTDANWTTGYKKGDLVRGIPLVCFEIIADDVLKASGWTPLPGD